MNNFILRFITRAIINLDLIKKIYFLENIRCSLVSSVDIVETKNK